MLRQRRAYLILALFALAALVMLGSNSQAGANPLTSPVLYLPLIQNNYCCTPEPSVTPRPTLPGDTPTPEIRPTLPGDTPTSTPTVRPTLPGDPTETHTPTPRPTLPRPTS